MWVLIVIFAGHGSSMSPSVFTQEFNTPKACLNAKVVIESYKVYDEVRVACLPKGDVK
jgi:hypothetical protein